MHYFRGLLASLIVLLVSLPLQSAAPSSAYAGKVDQTLADRLSTGGRFPALIKLARQADTSAAQLLPTKAAKGRAVVAALRAQAAQSQPAVLAALAARGIKGEGLLSLNAISAEIDAETAQMLAQRPDVLRIHDDGALIQVAPVLDEPTLQSPNATEWGVNNVKAPQVWALGIRGQGIVVAGEDTGVRWDHNALKNQYRGWNGATASHDYNWYDGVRTAIVGGSSCGVASPTPCDDNSHGTHTVGTMIGDDGGANQIGVAPAAKWIACRNMDNGSGRPSTYIRCIDWMLAPYPVTGTTANGDPDKAPDIINNSWGCPLSEECTGTPADGVQTAVQNVTNAGILFVASAGNEGSGCASIGDAPALYPESFTVGSHTSTGAISGFSSRGPVTYNGATRVGPDVSAPGSSVRSAVSSSVSGYSTFSGTSMAGPHVAGVAALLWSARPELRGQISLTRAILQQTAVDTTSTQTCGTTPGTSIPNNTFGHGKVDALAAIATTLQGSITVNGTAAPTATLTIASPALQLSTATGAYSTTLPTGTYNLTAQVAGFAPQTVSVSITSGSVTTQNFAFTSPAAADVTIADFSFTPQNLTINAGESVTWLNTGSATHTSTSTTGVWNSGNLSNGEDFSFTFPTAGVFPYVCAIHSTMTGTITVLGGEPAEKLYLPLILK